MVNVSSTFLDQKVVDDFVRQKAALAPKVAEIAEALSRTTRRSATRRSRP